MLSWAVRRTRLPLLSLRCLECGSAVATAEEGKFRVNANGKLLDVWLLVHCVSCGHTSKIAVRERVPVRSVAPDRLHAFETNDPALVAQTLLDPLVARRNRFALDWTGAWRLHTPPDPPADTGWPFRVEVGFHDPVPVRPERLIAHGLGISRGDVRHRIKCDVPLNRRTTTGFGFVVFPGHQAQAGDEQPPEP
ncbi:DUF1062 domain-containing protein [Thermoactinospora rubra]|uniref:DUF1062 domain-containing protein n=1 Tax=Thermoactinospora rubra TaxID=1088767 RepID=UPI001F0AE2EC|nr:DUF1062 domain-containing protein [Thermoactinospora rubra]